MARNPNLSLTYIDEQKELQNDEKTDADLWGSRPDWWWTGKPPVHGVCPGVEANKRIYSLPLINLNGCTREQIQDYFDNSWTLTEVLFSALQGEKIFYEAPYHQLRHPLIFYYGHPASVYVNKLRVAGFLDGPLNEHYEQIFETGVDEMSWDDMSKNEMNWPSLKEVNNYRQTVYNTIKKIIAQHPALENNNRPITQESPAWALFMGMEHERIHLETSSVLFRELIVNFLRCPDQWPDYHPTAKQPFAHSPQSGIDYPENEMVAVSAAKVNLGKPHDWPSFGWDNEYGERKLQVRPFKASQYLISNGEFYEFVKAGAYREECYWSEDGWKWKCFRNVKWPTFWVAYGPAGLHKYKLRTCFEIIDMPWSWPVNVNYHEAKAYCAWRAQQDNRKIPYRVITEAEHQQMRDQSCFDESRGFKRDAVMAMSGYDILQAKNMNLNLAYGAETPVDAMQPTSDGFYDVFGNLWQWCEDDFNPLENFRPHYTYDDFSAPCFDGEHNIILGGSFVSTGDEASIWARYHFRSHFFQHAGFRLACSNDGNPTCDAIKIEKQAIKNEHYETQQMLNEYLLLHYGAADDAMPYSFGPKDAINFPTRCGQAIVELATELNIPTSRVIDVGCAVGGAVFEMARTFEQAVGIDLSKSFIDAANALKQDGSLKYFRKDEGKLGQQVTAIVDKKIKRQRVTFRCADACALPSDLVGFNVALLSNLIDRLPSPQACLARMSGDNGLVLPGGLLVIMSPYTWMEQFTPAKSWLGGYQREDTKIYTKEGIKATLGSNFVFITEKDMPLLIREHSRKYQYIVSHMTVWQRQQS